MARYKVLQSVAHNIGHSFTSLMNYAYDDYVMGHLLWNARATGLEIFTLDLLTGAAEPAALIRGSIVQVPTQYAQAFAYLVARQGTSLAYIHSARLEVRFELRDRRPLVTAPGGYVASPYRCEVVITDDRGKAYTADFAGTWYPERPDPPYMPSPAEPAAAADVRPDT